MAHPNENDSNKGTKIDPRFAFYAGYSAVAIVTILIFIKTWAYYASGSTSILSSLTDSLLDSLVSVTALGSIYYAQRPADEDHRWGHGKMEAVSALFQSAIILGGAAFLVFEAALRFLEPAEIQKQSIGIAVMVVSILLSVLLVCIQNMSLKKAPSLAVEADRAHYGSDILINAGVLIVLFISMFGAPLWIDPLFTVLVAGFLVRVSHEIGSKAVDMLMDRELPEEERARIEKTILDHEGVLGFHDLRTTRHGMTVVMSFDIEVDADLSLRDAHNIAKDIEKELLEMHHGAEILIHVDPEDDTDDARHKVKGVHH